MSSGPDEELRIPILTYHSYRCGERYEESDHVALHDDLRTIHARGYTIVPLRWIAQWVVGARRLPAGLRPVGICFDDGAALDYRDVLHPLFGPQKSFATILREFATEIGPGGQPHLQATSFVIASPGVRRRLDECGLHGLGWMSDDWWPEASRSGLIEIASHSWDHCHELAEAVCARSGRRGTFHDVETLEECDCEVARAASFIGEHIAPAWPVLFAYPYGEASSYLREVYLPAYPERHRTLAAFGASGGYAARSSSRWDLPRLVCGAHWTSGRQMEEVLLDSRPGGGSAGGERTATMEISIERVTDAAFFAGDLFRRVFGHPVPSEPVHYVAFAKREDGTLRAVGYYHVAYRGMYALVGGLCVDPDFRRLAIGERLERAAFENLGDASAFFAHVGNPTRAKRVGFRETEHPHLVVRWMKEVGAEEKRQIIDEVVALGPF